MKKLVALVLGVTVATALCAPALAAQTTCSRMGQYLNCDTYDATGNDQRTTCYRMGQFVHCDSDGNYGFRHSTCYRIGQTTYCDSD